jgi:murein L,D-transpeptidase YafK
MNLSGRAAKILGIAGGTTLVAGVAAFLFVSEHFLVMGDRSTLPDLRSPRMVIHKGERRLELFDGEKLVKTYAIALGSSPVGDKAVEGDGRTPEGSFYIFTKNPQSRFYLSLGVSYPNQEDAERGRQDGQITEQEYREIVDAIGSGGTPPQKTKLGGEIYIHGGGTFADWTEGCIALRNRDVNELFEALDVGTPVEILP